MVKRWRTGFILQETPQPPIPGTHQVLNRFAVDPDYDINVCKELIQKHILKRA